jgi:hypothetical protein
MAARMEVCEMNNFAKWENRIRFGLLAFVSALMLWAFHGLITEAQAKPYRQYVKPVCEWPGCSAMEKLEVHHVIPQNVLKDTGILELVDDPRNLVTLCEYHHFTFAHLCNFSLNNMQLIDMMTAERNRLAGSGHSTPPAPLADPHQPLPAIHDVQPERK